MKTHRRLPERMSVPSDDLDSLRVRKPEIQSSRKGAECGKAGAPVLFIHCIASTVKEKVHQQKLTELRCNGGRGR